jgi:hypothetical protein
VIDVVPPPEHETLHCQPDGQATPPEDPPLLEPLLPLPSVGTPPSGKRRLPLLLPPLPLPPPLPLLLLLLKPLPLLPLQAGMELMPPSKPPTTIAIRTDERRMRTLREHHILDADSGSHKQTDRPFHESLQ